MPDRVHSLVLRLAGYRQALGISQQALADDIGVTRKTVSRWESGVSEMPVSAAAVYARAVGARLTVVVDEPSGEVSGG